MLEAELDNSNQEKMETDEQYQMKASLTASDAFKNI